MVPLQRFEKIPKIRGGENALAEESVCFAYREEFAPVENFSQTNDIAAFFPPEAKIRPTTYDL